MCRNQQFTLFVLLVTSLYKSTISLNLPLKENPVEPPLKIAAFNVQNLGDKKLASTEEMEIIKRIILRYDVICIQEIVTKDQERLQEMIASLNLKTPNDVIYRMALSERLGRETAKEQYAYIYRDDKLSVLDEQTFPDGSDLFMRPPYIVHFSSPTTRDLSSFVAICSHTQPSSAANETHALATVYDYAHIHYENPDAIIMGDFNAGCSNIRVGDWNWIELWTREEFKWLIGHHIDTTTYVSSCPYDRFVIAGSKMGSAVIPGSPKVFDFQEEYRLTDDQTKDVSDHLPIELQMRGKMSEVAEQYLKSKTCFTIEDGRHVSNVLILYEERDTLPILVKLLTDTNNVMYVKAYSKSSNINNIINNLNLLSTTFQDFVSKETFEAVKYKVLHGGLDDASSFVILEEPVYMFQVECNSYTSICATTVCKETNVN